MKTIVLLISALSIAGLTSCTISRGTYVDPAAFRSIKKGQSTKADVVALIGYPAMQITDGAGSTTFHYLHESGDPCMMAPQGDSINLIGTASKTTQTTTISFSPSGVVRSKNQQQQTQTIHPLLGTGRAAPSQGIGPRKSLGLVE